MLKRNGLGLPNSERGLRRAWEGLEEINNAVPPRRISRVGFFGSARTPADNPLYPKYREMGCAITTAGFDVFTGGGPGLMAAVNEGAMEGMRNNPRAWSHGVCIKNVNREERPNEFLKQAYYHGLILTRIHQMVRLGWFGAFIVGEAFGYGSVAEWSMIHQLVQLDHMPRDVAIVCIGRAWKDLRKWQQAEIIDTGCADPGDIDITQYVDTPMEAAEIAIEACRRSRALMAAG